MILTQDAIFHSLPVVQDKGTEIKLGKMNLEEMTAVSQIR